MPSSACVGTNSKSGNATGFQVGRFVTVNTGRHEHKTGIIIGEPTKNLFSLYCEGHKEVVKRFFNVKKTSVAARDPKHDSYPFHPKCEAPDFRGECKCLPEGSGVGHDLIEVTGGNFEGYYGEILGMANAAHYRVALHGINTPRTIRVYNCEVLYDLPLEIGSMSTGQKRSVAAARKIARCAEQPGAAANTKASRNPRKKLGQGHQVGVKASVQMTTQKNTSNKVDAGKKPHAVSATLRRSPRKPQPVSSTLRSARRTRVASPEREDAASSGLGEKAVSKGCDCSCRQKNTVPIPAFMPPAVPFDKSADNNDADELWDSESDESSGEESSAEKESQVGEEDGQDEDAEDNFHSCDEGPSLFRLSLVLRFAKGMLGLDTYSFEDITTS